MTIVSRAEAKRQGLKTYYTGKPCKNGHIAFRHTASENCSECHKLSAKRYYQNNCDSIKAKVKTYQTSNSQKCLALKAKRRATKKSATPNWLTSHQLAEIQLIYIATPTV